jgi:hypothetical protein
MRVFLVCGVCHVFKMHAAVKVVPVRASNLQRMSRGISPLSCAQNTGSFLQNFLCVRARARVCVCVAPQYGMHIFDALVAY